MTLCTVVHMNYTGYCWCGISQETRPSTSAWFRQSNCRHSV